jgi:hypothetical protein
LAHNLIPHHHHYKVIVASEHHHPDHDDHHEHLPLSFAQVDEVYNFKSYDLKQTPPAFAAVVPYVAIFEKIFETKLTGFISNPIGHPPPLSYLLAFAYRGPPAV